MQVGQLETCMNRISAFGQTWLLSAFKLRRQLRQISGSAVDTL